MDVHLITTDKSCFQLIETIGEALNVTTVVVPSNRLDTDKVKEVIEIANSMEIPVSIHQSRARFDSFLSTASVAISWLYSQVICEQDLARYSTGILNMHGGKLPEYRGASVLHWAIVNGERELGVSWHQMVEAIDAGPIYAEGQISISPKATALELRKQMIVEATKLFPIAWHKFLSRENLRVPNNLVGKIWPQRKPSDSHIKYNLAEKEVRDLVRAMCWPWPRSYIFLEGKRVEIDRVSNNFKPGAILYETSDDKRIYLLPVRAFANF